MRKLCLCDMCSYPGKGALYMSYSLRVWLRVPERVRRDTPSTRPTMVGNFAPSERRDPCRRSCASWHASVNGGRPSQHVARAQASVYQAELVLPRTAWLAFARVIAVTQELGSNVSSGAQSKRWCPDLLLYTHERNQCKQQDQQDVRLFGSPTSICVHTRLCSDCIH